MVQKSQWPSCSNCRYVDAAGRCGYRPSRPWTKVPAADIGCYGVCGYWHGEKDETIRARCRMIVALVSRTRPPGGEETS